MLHVASYDWKMQYGSIRDRTVPSVRHTWQYFGLRFFLHYHWMKIWQNACVATCILRFLFFDVFSANAKSMSNWIPMAWHGLVTRHPSKYKATHANCESNRTTFYASFWSQTKVEQLTNYPFPFFQPQVIFPRSAYRTWKQCKMSVNLEYCSLFNIFKTKVGSFPCVSSKRTWHERCFLHTRSATCIHGNYR